MPSLKSKKVDVKQDQIILQGNQPTDDPSKYGLKFDCGKARWELVPFDELKDIIAIPNTLIKTSFKQILLSFDEHQIFDEIMESITIFIQYHHLKRTEDFERMCVAGFLMFFILRGKSYTEEELVQASHTMRWDLFDINEIQKVVDVYTYGAKLYADNNWKNVAKERYMSALLRHFKTVRTKERYDGESGFLHLHHAIWNVIALLWLQKNR